MRMLISEPVLLLIGLYILFVYGLVYIRLETFPFVFEEVDGMSTGVSSLPFILYGKSIRKKSK